MTALTRTELVLDRAHNAVITMDEHGRVTYWNLSAESVFGIPREQALGREVAELVIPERLRDAHRAGVRRFLVDVVGPLLDRRVEVTALRADGGEFPVEMTISAIRDEGGWTFTTFLQDISERREAEREGERLVEELRHALAGSERRFEAIVGSLTALARKFAHVFGHAAWAAGSSRRSASRLRSARVNFHSNGVAICS